MVRSLFATCVVLGLGMAAPVMERNVDCESDTSVAAQTTYPPVAQTSYPQPAQTTDYGSQPTGYPEGPDSSSQPGMPPSSSDSSPPSSSEGSGYPTSQPGMPPQGSGYPTSQPGMPQGSGYPTQPGNPEGSGYPSSQPGMPQGSGYPTQPSNSDGSSYPTQPSNSDGSSYPTQPSSPQGSTYPSQTASEPSSTETPGGSGGGATPGGPYKTYTGSGTDWPTMSQWVGSFETLWKANEPAMQESCEANGWGTNNSPTEIKSIHDNIQSVAKSNDLDPRFLLAIMMQESKGCVRVKTTANAHPNPGLMQSGGTTSCVGKTPCPDDQIKAMIQDGVTGPDGLKTTMAKATGPANGLKLYRAAVLYNSGINLDVSTTLAGPGAATPCYASDIVNRLMGTLTGGASKCQQVS